MKNMKKLATMGLAAVMMLSALGCGQSAKTETSAATKAETTAATKAETTAAAKTETTAAEKAETTAAAGGVLTMATNAEFDPWEYHEGGEIVGIDIEMAQAIADKLGMELKIEDMAFDAIIPSVVSKKADFGMAAITENEERKVSVDFTDNYAESALVILVKNDNTDITSADSLEERKSVFSSEPLVTQQQPIWQARTAWSVIRLTLRLFSP